jgi:hypothetical protein
MGLSNYPPGVSGNEPQITGYANYPGPLPTNYAVDQPKIPDMRKLADEVMDKYGDYIEQIAMDLASSVPGFDPDMIDYDDFLDGPHRRMVDRVWKELFSHLIAPENQS